MGIQETRSSKPIPLLLTAGSMLVLTNRARQVPGSNSGVSSTDFQEGIMKESSLTTGAVIPIVGL